MVTGYKVYLGGPINGRDDSCKEWRQVAKSTWPFACIDPMRRDYRGQEAACVKEIVELDKHDIRVADFCVFLYDRPSVGTSMEMLYAWQLGKPVILINISGSENLSPWLVYHATKIVTELSQARDAIESWRWMK